MNNGHIIHNGDECAVIRNVDNCFNRNTYIENCLRILVLHLKKETIRLAYKKLTKYFTHDETNNVYAKKKRFRKMRHKYRKIQNLLFPLLALELSISSAIFHDFYLLSPFIAYHFVIPIF